MSLCSGRLSSSAFHSKTWCCEFFPVDGKQWASSAHVERPNSDCGKSISRAITPPVFFTVSFNVCFELRRVRFLPMLPPIGIIVHCTIGDVLFSRLPSEHLMPYRYSSICIDTCISKEDVPIYCHIDFFSTALIQTQNNQKKNSLQALFQLAEKL